MEREWEWEEGNIQQAWREARRDLKLPSDLCSENPVYPAIIQPGLKKDLAEFPISSISGLPTVISPASAGLQEREE